MDQLREGLGYTIPVRALYDALDAFCEWDNIPHSAAMENWSADLTDGAAWVVIS